MPYKDNLSDIIELLSHGKLILTPTDTIWGISCDATNESAVKRIFDLKNRAMDQPLITLVSDINMLKSIVPDLHPRIQTLHHYHERPLTVIYPGPILLPGMLKEKNDSAAIRIVKSGICHDIIRHFGKPITSSSANLAGENFPSNFGEIRSEILHAVDYIVKTDRDSPVSKEPSVIVKYNDEGELEVIRS